MYQLMALPQIIVTQTECSKLAVPRRNTLKRISNEDHLQNDNLFRSFGSGRIHQENDNKLANDFRSISSQPCLKNNNHVAIILGYYDGHAFIEEQLQSIFKQTHSAFHVFLCDDKSSSPFNVENLNLDAKQRSQLSVGVRTENIGFSKNFLNTLASVGDDFEYW